MLSYARAKKDPLPPKASRKDTHSRNWNWNFPVGVASIILGVLAMMQFRTQMSTPYLINNYSNSDTTRLIIYSETERNRLTEELDQVKTQLKEAQDLLGETGRKADQETIKLLKDEVDKANMQAGLIPVKGPGVLVKLDDSLQKPAPGEDPYFYLVHDVDIQTFVNELWAAGAEAIAVNDQRVAISTSVRCVGPTIMVNAVRLAPPYMIRAIGNPSTLETALRMQGGVLSSLAQSIAHGVRVDIQKESEMILPEFKGGSAFRYAEPVSAR